MLLACSLLAVPNSIALQAASRRQRRARHDSRHAAAAAAAAADERAAAARAFHAADARAAAYADATKRGARLRRRFAAARQFEAFFRPVDDARAANRPRQSPRSPGRAPK